MLIIKRVGQFDKSMKLAIRRGKKIDKIQKVIEILQRKQLLPERYKDHKLIGNYVGSRECHIEPDWLLRYRIDGEFLILLDTGTHSDLF